MQCPSCGQQTEEGKFCTNCGAALPQEEQAAYQEPTGEDADFVQQHQATQQNTQQQGEVPYQQQTPQQPNEAVEKLKEVGNNFGNFFLTLLKRPADAKKANRHDWISGIITLVIFALIFALGYFFILKSTIGSSAILEGFGNIMGDSLASTIPFTDGFLFPLLKLMAMIAITIVLTFATLKLATSDFDFLDTLSKYSAYTVPFMILLVLGTLMMLIKLPVIGGIILFTSLIGMVIIIPALLLMEEKSVGIDRIYLLLITVTINFAVFFYLIMPFIAPVVLLGGLDSQMDNIMNNEFNF